MRRRHCARKFARKSCFHRISFYFFDIQFCQSTEEQAEGSWCWSDVSELLFAEEQQQQPLMAPESLEYEHESGEESTTTATVIKRDREEKEKATAEEERKPPVPVVKLYMRMTEKGGWFVLKMPDCQQVPSGSGECWKIKLAS